jgi:predicted nicotinamide N-methyase
MANDLDRATLAELLAVHAPLAPVPLCPSLRAFSATDELPLWQAIEDACGHRIDAPFFAVAWPGAQVVARAILAGTVDVRGRRVLELGCGSGLSSVAAALAGAAHVRATDIDALALLTTSLLAEANGAHGVQLVTGVLSVLDDDAIMAAVDDTDVVIAADVVYNRELGLALSRLIGQCRSRGIDLVVADSGRPFFDPAGLAPTESSDVPVPFGVEGRASRRVVLYR